MTVSPVSEVLKANKAWLSLSFVVCACALRFIHRLSSYKSRKGGARILPGPKGSLIFGNRQQLPKEMPWLQLKKWADEYGPLYRLRFGVEEVVVINSAEHAVELLDKRSQIYSSRPRQIFASEIVSRGLRMVFMPYNELWKTERKLLHKLTSPQAAATYEPLQDIESTQLMLDMLERPKSFWGHCQRYAGSFIMRVAFNKHAKRNTDRNVADMRAIIEELVAAAMPGKNIVDSLPILRYLPSFLAPWKAEGERLFEKQDLLFNRHLGDIKRGMAAGEDSACFVKYLMENQKTSGLTEQQIAFLGGVMYAAGSDTTSDALCTFIMTMVNHPEQQRLAQAEIDKVVGRDRMPSFEDQKDLVYVSALVREVQRWRPVIAAGLPHATTEDDVYMGYFIPKGATIIGNTWAIHNDPDLYPEPQLFKPERFIDSEGRLQGNKFTERGHFGFGFGRRICPGMYLGERSLFIVFSRMLWGFNIRTAQDASGNAIHVSPNAYSTGFSSHPKVFQCAIEPRDDGVAKVIRSAAEAHSLL